MVALLGNLYQTPTEDRMGQIIDSIDYQDLPIREAIRRLFRKYLFVGTVAPDVQGNVTVSLVNVPFETVLQNLTRQVNATYRLERGWFYIVRREWDSPVVLPQAPQRSEVERAYDALDLAVKRGDGPTVRRFLTPEFVVRNPTGTLKGEPAFRKLVANFRQDGPFEIKSVGRDSGKQIGYIQALVAYRRPGAPSLGYRDFWFRPLKGTWQLYARHELVPVASRRFHNALLSKVIKTLGDEVGIVWIIDPGIDRLVDVDLTGVSLETYLAQISKGARLGTLLEGDVNRLVPRKE